MVEIIGDAVPLAGASAALPKNSVYRSLSGRGRLHAFYDRVLARLPYPVRTQYVHTRFGRTHVTVGGNANGAPLLIIPGMSISGPMMMEFFDSCARSRQLIALDLIGHPGRSEDRVHTPHGHAFGLWLADVLDGLNLERADIAAASFGASVALDLAAIAPQRVGKLALVMPAGLTPRLPYLRLYVKFFLPWITYRYFPDRGRVTTIAEPLGETLSEDDVTYFDIVVRHTAFWRHRPAGPFFADDLSDYREAVFLVTAGRDQLLPSVPTRANARKALRIAHEVHLPESTHMPPPGDMAAVHAQIADYFA
jgi:2-hydroxy-6-oxonona-2,4-dienedioate hydrolase